MPDELTDGADETATQRRREARYARAEPSPDAAVRYEYEAKEPEVRHAGVGVMLGVCERPYLDAAQLLDIRSEFVNKLEELTTFDHRTLQGAHRQLAARYARLPGVAQFDLLPEPDPDPRRTLVLRWRAWFLEEVERLSKIGWFCRAVVTAAAFPNPDPRGIEAEDLLYERLAPDSDWL